MNRAPACVALASVLLSAAPSVADSSQARARVGGYLRMAARPDLQGGDGRLGFWNLYGRLLNEGSWAALELNVDLLPPQAARSTPWSTATFRVEGNSIFGADAGNGGLSNYRFFQAYVRAGNLFLKDVTWQLGTLQTWMGDLGLYDFRPAELFFGTLGLSGTYRNDDVEVLVGVGDSGFALRGTDYSPVLTAGGQARWLVNEHLAIGAGGAYYFEANVSDNPNAPHATENLSYENFVRGEVVQRYAENFPGQEELFYRNRPIRGVSADSFKLIAYLGFGNLGPLRWNNLFANYLRRHPQSRTTESYDGAEYILYVTELTDERYEVNVGNEMQLIVWPGVIEAAWGTFYGRHWNEDNAIVAGEDNRTIASTVLRLQGFITDEFHLLLVALLGKNQTTAMPTVSPTTRFS